MLGNWSDSLDHLIHLLVAFADRLEPVAGWNAVRGLRTFFHWL